MDSLFDTHPGCPKGFFSGKREPTPAIDLHCRQVMLRSETVDEEARSVEAVIATDQPVRVYDWATDRMVDEILLADGARFPKIGQVPLLDSHSRWSVHTVLGSIRSLQRTENEITGRLFFAQTEVSREAFGKVRDRHITDISAGYAFERGKFIDIPAGGSQVINGTKYSAGAVPLRVVTEWHLREGSLVPIGADDAAKIRKYFATVGSPQAQPTNRGNPMNEQLRAFLESKGLKSGATDAEAWAFYRGLDEVDMVRADALRSGDPPAAPPANNTTSEPAVQPTAGDNQTRSAADTPPASPPTPAPTQTPEQIRAEAVRAERERITSIEELGELHDVPGEQVRNAIANGMSYREAASSFLEFVRGRRSTGVQHAPAGIVRDNEREGTAEVIGASIMMRFGLTENQLPINDAAVRADPDRHRQAQAVLAEQADRFRAMSVIDVCRASIQMCGGSDTGIYDPSEIWQRACELSLSGERAGSSGTLLAIFSNVVNAGTYATFQQYPDTTRVFTREADLPNFLTAERFGLDNLGSLTKLPDGNGEADHAKPNDFKETYKLARYANQFQMDERDAINDRFDLLMRMPRMMGESAARLRPDLVYAILLANAALEDDNVALFHATHNNLITPALSVTGLGTGIQTLGKQTVNSVNLNLRAAHLLVPQDLKQDAHQILRSIRLTGQGSNAAAVGDYNPIQAENIDPVVDNRLGVAGVTDPDSGTAYAGTTTNWILAASQAAIEVGFLRGSRRRPRVRGSVLTQGRWGLHWDINHDIAAKALHYAPLVKSSGTT